MTTFQCVWSKLSQMDEEEKKNGYEVVAQKRRREHHVSRAATFVTLAALLRTPPYWRWCRMRCVLRRRIFAIDGTGSNLCPYASSRQCVTNGTPPPYVSLDILHPYKWTTSTLYDWGKITFRVKRTRYQWKNTRSPGCL